MIRNSIDHGIEMENERTAAGKEAEGVVTINAFRRGGYFYFEIQVDGRGLDREKILAKAQRLGLIDSMTLSDEETYDLIFSSGFSTRDEVSETSGRGVGMDAVRESIRHVKGTYQIESEPGKGTSFTIRLPLTLAVFN